MTIAELIAKLDKQREAKLAEMHSINEEAAGEERSSLNEAEQRAYDAAKEEVAALDARIADLEDQEKREKEAGDAAKRAGDDRPQVTSEPLTYRRGGQFSFFGDVLRHKVQGDMQAFQRLQQHAQEQADEVERRQRAFETFEEEAREEEIEFVRGGAVQRAERRRYRQELERRDLTRTDGAGGEFVPPLWLVDEFAEFARAGRPVAELFNQRPLPPGTDSINIPRITGGSSAATQTADNAAVAEVDPTTATLSVPVRTIAGQVDVALQLIEQSPVSFDEIVFADLIADYNASLDSQLLNGSGASGQILGIRSVTGINAVTYTDASPTVPELHPKVMDAINQAVTGRKLPVTAIVMHPRRWFWMAAALGTDNRPLVPIQGGPLPTPLAQGESLSFEGPVGVVGGLPVYLDPNLPVNLGAGTNEDMILVIRYQDMWLWEGVLRTRTLPEVGSGNLTVRLQVYNYAAATAGRYPAGISTVGGTGLVTPTF